jgi:lipopolysaccharide assembly protein B
MMEWLFLLLPLAAASGWYFAYRNFSTQTVDKKSGMNSNYLLGINYLLNEQADKAVDTFIKILEVDIETVETHLALGVLFRRRGEIDRAIRLHQNLIARPQLPKIHRIQALLALGQDYYHSGLLDRAERLFSQLISEKNEYGKMALHYLLDIYQQQKHWARAIEHGQKIAQSDSYRVKDMAHYYCELALMAQKENNSSQANDYLNKALRYDPHCVRASLIKGKWFMQDKKWKAAIEVYQRVKQQDPDYLTETLHPLQYCYAQKMAGQKAFLDYLQTVLEEYPKPTIYLAMVELFRQHDPEHARQFLIQQLQIQPSLQGIYHLMELNLDKSEACEQEKNHWILLKEFVTELLKKKTIYRCFHCGFNSKILDWLCPACRRWGSIKPNID